MTVAASLLADAREFLLGDYLPIAKPALLARLRSTLAEVAEALGTLDESVLLERCQASKEDVTVLWAILHAVEHFAMHTGQIIVLTKIRTGSALHLSR